MDLGLYCDVYRQFGLASHPNSLCLAATLPATAEPTGCSSVLLRSPRDASTSESEDEALEDADENDDVVEEAKVGMVSVENTDALSPDAALVSS